MAGDGAGSGSRRSGPQSREWRQLFRKQFRKTKMCRFYPSGECRYASECPYAHDESEISHPPDLTKTALCVDFQKGCCDKDIAECPYAHGPGDLRTTEAFSNSPLCKRTSAKPQDNNEDAQSDTPSPSPSRQQPSMPEHVKAAKQADKQPQRQGRALQQQQQQKDEHKEQPHPQNQQPKQQPREQKQRPPKPAEVGLPGSLQQSSSLFTLPPSLGLKAGMRTTFSTEPPDSQAPGGIEALGALLPPTSPAGYPGGVGDAAARSPVGGISMFGPVASAGVGGFGECLPSTSMGMAAIAAAAAGGSVVAPNALGDASLALFNQYGLLPPPVQPPSPHLAQSSLRECREPHMIQKARSQGSSPVRSKLEAAGKCRLSIVSETPGTTSATPSCGLPCSSTNTEQACSLTDSPEHSTRWMADPAYLINTEQGLRSFSPGRRSDCSEPGDHLECNSPVRCWPRTPSSCNSPARRMSPMRRCSRELTPTALNNHLCSIFGTAAEAPTTPATGPAAGDRRAGAPSLLSAAGGEFDVPFAPWTTLTVTPEIPLPAGDAEAWRSCTGTIGVGLLPNDGNVPQASLGGLPDAGLTF
mmetsp:Transcript_50805/g.148053  ORF Transcript_50805/g.148053 Transcript_50805/m.148053 type:complete len:585 (+) Transcript_50805:70-1824(+)